MKTLSAFGNVTIEAFELTSISELEIYKTINEHTKLRFVGTIPEDKKDTYISESIETSQIKIYKNLDSSKKLIFCGIIKKAYVKSIRGTYNIFVEALSNTHDLDVVRIKKSFQDINMTYNALIKEVLGNYGAYAVDDTTNGKTTGEFIVQYNETDWEFLKRMASRFNAGLIPDSINEKPCLYFGPSSAGDSIKVNNHNYSVEKPLSDFRVKSKNYIDGLVENDYMYYIVDDLDVSLDTDIGGTVIFNEQTLYVHSKLSYIKAGVLKYKYTLSTKNGLKQSKLYNKNIQGVSINGNILEVKKDKLKVHLTEIDKSQDIGKAYWFPYSTMYTSENNVGWYCMPEIGDTVRVYFSTIDDSSAISISSIQKDPPKDGAPPAPVEKVGGLPRERLADTDVKSLKTIYGKEIILAPDRIVIHGDGVTISLIDDEGISIESNTAINICSKDSIKFESKLITLSAEDKIELTCKDNKITLENDIKIEGSEVKTN